MDLKEIYQFVIVGDMEGVESSVKAALAEGVESTIILNESLISAMSEVGRRYENGEFFVPEMLVSARAMQSGLRLLKPHLVASGVPATGRVAIGTVKGDLHDIGKNLVGMMLEGAGFEILDLGVDVAPDTFLDAVRQGAQIVCMSALLTTTMNNMGITIKALEDAGLRENVKVLIGGAPVTSEFAKSIGADAFAPDASSATRIARELLG
jgi:5-methyltetrahydrofolate--homocysteine methyltransferase